MAQSKAQGWRRDKTRAETARSPEEDAKAQENRAEEAGGDGVHAGRADALAAVEVPQGQEAPAPVPIEQAWQQAAQQVQVAAQDPGAAAAIAAEIGQDPADVAAALQELPAAAGRLSSRSWSSVLSRSSRRVATAKTSWASGRGGCASPFTPQTLSVIRPRKSGPRESRSTSQRWRSRASQWGPRLVWPKSAGR